MHLKRFVCFVFLAGCFFNSNAQGVWKKKAEFIGGKRQSASSFVIGEKAYVGMGNDELSFKNDFWMYDAANDKWWQKPNFPGEARIAAFAFSVNGKGYIGGGQAGTQDKRNSLTDFWEFDPETNAWTKLNDFPGGMRYSAIAFSINGKGYVGLGSDASVFYNDLWEYDPATDKWKKKSDFPGSARMEATSFVVNSEAYVVMGQKNKFFGKEKDGYKYNPLKDQWTQIADFPGVIRIGESSFSIEDKGYLLGGYNGITQRNKDMWEYDVKADKWNQLPDPACGAKDYSFCFVINTAAYIGAGQIPKNFAMVNDLWQYYIKPAKPIVNTKDNFAYGGSILRGNERVPIPNVEVKLTNGNDPTGKIASTNLYGSFLFSSIPPSENYWLKLVITDRQLRSQKIYLVNRSNQLVAVLDSLNDFTFKIDPSEIAKFQLLKVENKNLRMDLDGKLALDDNKKTPLKNISVALISSDEQVVQMTNTDASGKYSFTYLKVDTGLYISLNEKDLSFLPKESTILMIDSKDNVVAKSKASQPIFHFSYLPAEEHSLSKIYVEDPWVQIANMGSKDKNILDTLRLIENIYFDVAKFDIAPEAKATLNKAIIAMKNNTSLSIEISAHTDSRGDANSNLTLSEKRANAAKDYLISQGIDKNRITAKGFGESKLLNKCKDGVECTEDEHAKNRRMEFKFNMK